MIQNDKIKHLIVCAIISLSNCILCKILGGDINSACYAGVSTAIACGLGKEYGDKSNPNNKWDWGDLLFDCIGAGIGVLFAFLIINI